MSKSKCLFFVRVCHKTKTVAIAPREKDKLSSSGIKLVEKNGQLFGSWAYLRKIGRDDLDMWPVPYECEQKDKLFRKEFIVRSYKEDGFTIVSVKNYETHYPLIPSMDKDV